MRMIRLNEEYLDRVLAGDLDLAPRDTAPCALALGSFDGLHRGHQALVAALLEAKDRDRLRASVLFTFRRHPRLVLGGAGGPFLLTTWRERLALLEQLGVDVLVAMDFSAALSRLDYRDFVKRFLVEWLGMTHFVAGHDVHLGKDRRGDAAALRELGARLGYSLDELPPTSWQGRVISSSAIRNALSAGDCAAASAMLGRPYAAWGEVSPGDGRGLTIGFPTANVQPLNPRKLLPAPGVYACRVQVPGDVATPGGDGLLRFVEESLPEIDRHGDVVSPGHGRWRLYGGMLNFGNVPTFHGDGLPLPRLEVHLFDFAGDLRGRTVKVEWLRRLRDERRFGGVDDLVVQLRHDEAQAREVVAATPFPGD
ncbi:MAG TPA: bifunctional riboflavin kinase/FMN adenylyltransferase [Candidatus Krumholzibacteria bacterium]|nr:bifunctional riboflavin kinase/FMN adenylyltransferase [Candidatus Krumholzibacteria bacterium]HPD71312.1 bifunctional riboflavin kinase/FMN adenylyltransferase [Candidatus Krumholzibacteria bacterium]HRY38988.1 bifunctional riboflavin kinase/FMN adenylyltransferase [Candidatus Krumholzibacteria bacterium]